jgi:hypothetical protein
MTTNGRTVTRAGDRPITRADLEAKFEELRTGVGSGTDAARGAGPGIAVGVGILVLLAVYVLGRRRGKKRRTVVEIRRV